MKACPLLQKRSLSRRTQLPCLPLCKLEVTALASCRFNGLAASRMAAMDALMWDEGAGCWRDVHIAYGGSSGSADGGGGGDPDQQLEQPGSSSSSGPAPPHLMRDIRQSCGTYFSNWVPLWCGCAGAPGSARAVAAVQGLSTSGLIQACGVLTSDTASGQQWDAPNAWPPLVHMAVEGLAQSGVW